MESTDKQVPQESKLIVLTKLDLEMKDAYDNGKKWSTVIDLEGNAEIFFKYQGTTLFSIAEKEMHPESLCQTLLKIIQYPRTMTVNFLDLPYQNIFNEEYFPIDILNPAWILDYKNLNKLRSKFPEEFKDEIWASKDFRIVFLFRKNNVPPVLFEKTHVIEICKPDELKDRLAEREEKKTEQETKKEVKKVEPKEEKKEAPQPKTKSNTKEPVKKTGPTTQTKTIPTKTTTQAKTTTTKTNSTSNNTNVKTTKSTK
jgi:hypothetical protein